MIIGPPQKLGADPADNFDASVCVIMAIHNRNDLTVRAVEACVAAAATAGVRLRFVIFDDGSTDGSAESLLKVAPDTVQMIFGDGTAFWAKSMAVAEAHARNHRDDFLLWLNDDVELGINSIAALLRLASLYPDALIVGGMIDPRSRETSYSGYRKLGRWNPLRLRMVDLTGRVQRIDTVNGNCVLVPNVIVDFLGAIDGGFAHGWADIDYGLRASRAGIPILLAAEAAGECVSNHVQINGQPILEEWASYRSTKGGGNYASLLRFLSRHARGRAHLIIAQTYFLWWIRGVFRAVKHNTRGLA